MTRIQIIAQLDAEIERLERARDYLAAALTDSTTRLMRKVEKRLPVKQRKQTAVASTVPRVSAVVTRAVVTAELPATPAKVEASVAPPIEQLIEPQIRHVPPRRRMERRSLPDKVGKPAALSGPVPAGPVAVSANEARKMQERAVPPPPVALVTEPRPEIGAERSLASLIQAFERRTGISGLETT